MKIVKAYFIVYAVALLLALIGSRCNCQSLNSPNVCTIKTIPQQNFGGGSFGYNTIQGQTNNQYNVLQGFNVVGVAVDSSGIAVPINPGLWILVPQTGNCGGQNSINLEADSYAFRSSMGWIANRGFGANSIYLYYQYCGAYILLPTTPGNYGNMIFYISK